MTTVRKRGLPVVVSAQECRIDGLFRIKLLLYLFEDLFLNFCKKNDIKQISTNRSNKKIDRSVVKVKSTNRSTNKYQPIDQLIDHLC
jgi:hypothetical protein